MAPKKPRSSSCGPKAKAKGVAKAKATATPEEDPKVVLEREAEAEFKRWEPDNKLDGAIKLKEFADIVRGVNTRKCMIWGSDPAKIIEREWRNSGGKSKKELTLPEFKVWWLAFVESTNAEAAAKAAELEEKQAAAEEARRVKYGHGGVWQINLKDLPEAMLEARKKGRTPLIIDNTPGFLAERFFLYSDEGPYILECKKMVVDKAQGASVEDILTEVRNRFFSAKCFQYGRPLVFRMANSACDLKGAFSSDVFPSAALLSAGDLAKVLGRENIGNIKESPFAKMAPNSDEQLELDANGINDLFNVAVITQFPEEEYESFLKDAIPLHVMQPMRPGVD